MRTVGMLATRQDADQPQNGRKRYGEQPDDLGKLQAGVCTLAK